MGIKKLVNRNLQLFLHIIGWIILVIIPAYLFSDDFTTNPSYFFHTYFQLFIYALIFYLNYFLLIPKLFFKNKKLSYFLLAAFIISAFYSSIYISDKIYFEPTKDFKRFDETMDKMMKEHPMPRPSRSWPIYNYFLTSFLITGFSMGLRFSGKLRENEKNYKEAEKEKLNSELAFLKNQISPHFFFNTLNNIYSLAKINSDDTQNAILRLSKLMRYLLYESEHGNTQLSKEIDFMKNYIDLVKLRINDKINLSIVFPENFNDVEIPPLLFIPFIENAFKHGVSYREHSFIDISMKFSSGAIYFKSRNSIISKTGQSHESGSGIGLENVKKRLKLLYPDKHSLSISSSESSFEVSLEINVS